MQKILSLDTKDWFSGVAQGYHAGAGIWAAASGINPFVDLVGLNQRIGLLQANPAVTDLTSTVVNETPIGWTADLATNGDQTLYFNSTSHLYILNVSSDAGLTDQRTVANLANGTITFQPNGGTKYLYYWQKTQIGRFDLSSTYVDNQYTGLQSTVHHPTHRFLDAVFYGNKDRIGSLRDDGAAGVTHATNDLDFESNYECTTISDDGYYLVVGITRNTSASTGVYPGTKILFWDTNSSSWEKEWSIDAPDIISIKRVGTRMYALTSNGLYVFSYGTSPTLVHLHSAADVAQPNPTNGGHYSMDVLADGVLWGSANELHYYGKMTPDAPFAYHQPVSVPSGTAQMVVSSAKAQRIYVGTTTPKFGFYDQSSAGTPNTSVTAESIMIDLKNEWKIGRIDFVMGFPLASGDSLNIGLANDIAGSFTDFQKTNAVSFADYGAKMSAKLLGTFNAELLRMKLTWAGGTVKIKRIDVWGDKIDK